MSLPHFNPKLSVVTPDKVISSHFDAKFFNVLGVEIENLNIPVINIDETKNSSSLKATVNSSDIFIADYDNLSKIRYCYFSIKDRRNKSLKEVIYKITLIGVQCKFDYSLDTSYQENDCDFIITETHNFTDKGIRVDDAIKTILRGKKIDDILD